jgi:hypothetical protein
MCARPTSDATVLDFTASQEVKRDITSEDTMLLARHHTTEGLEVFDERGIPLGSVTLPTDPRLFGADKGTVFLNRAPSRTAAPKGPAQAA